MSGRTPNNPLYTNMLVSDIHVECLRNLAAKPGGPIDILRMEFVGKTFSSDESHYVVVLDFNDIQSVIDMLQRALSSRPKPTDN